MSGEDIVLLWRFPPTQEGRDMRTFNVYLDLGSSRDPLHLYKVDDRCIGRFNLVVTILDLSDMTCFSS